MIHVILYVRFFLCEEEKGKAPQNSARYCQRQYFTTYCIVILLILLVVLLVAILLTKIICPHIKELRAFTCRLFLLLHSV